MAKSEKEEKTAEAQESSASEKLVRIRAKRAILVGGEIKEPGWEGEVSAELAEQYCEPFEGQFAHVGLCSEDAAPRNEIVRAVRV